ncbi:MAG: hypothetical protein GXY65_07995, partial [Rhodococcus sp.]|nr:hypothetical protein [Rhodococcus sp. (in: high G+C Gram-positive bacteria)]
SAALRADDIDVPTRDIGVPQQFLDHASRSEIHRELGLTAQDVARQVTGWVVGLDGPDTGTIAPRTRGIG